MIWHASRRHTYIYIYIWKGSSRFPLLLVHLSFFIATITRLEMVGEMRLILSIGARLRKKKRKESLESLEREEIMERGRVVGTRRGNSRRERSSLLRGFGRAKSRVPKSLPPTLPRAGQSLQPDLFPRFRC